MNNKRITIQDIAHCAQVSVGTVDRVIHKRGKVSEDKKKKIEDAIRELNFNPNQLARALAMKKHFVVCSLFPQTQSEDEYWNLPNRGAVQAAEELRDFGFFLDSYYYSLFDEASFTEQANLILDQHPDGVILAPLFANESLNFIAKLDEAGIPYLFIDANIDGQNNVSYVGPDIERSGLLSGRLLCSLIKPEGRVLIVHIVKGMDNSSSVSRIEKGFRTYLQQNGLADKHPVDTLVINSIDQSFVNQELTKYYIANPGIKGVFVTTSKAHLVADFHRQHELDIRLLGFDLVDENIRCLQAGSIDCIISQSPIQQGSRAVKTMFDLLMHKNEARKLQCVPLDIILPENLEFYLNFQ